MNKYLINVAILLFSFVHIINAQTPEGLEELKMFGDSIAIRITQLDDEYVKNRFDLSYLLDNILIVEENNPELDDFNKGFKSSVLKNVHLSAKTIEHIEAGASFELLRVKIQENKKLLLFRLFDPESGAINYQEYLITGESPHYQIEDIYFYNTSEYISTSIKNFYINSIRTLGYYKGTQKSDAEDLLIFIASLIQENNYQEVEKLYQTLSPEFKQQKMLLAYRLLVTSKIDLDTYNEAIKDFESYHPDDPTLNLAKISLYYAKGDYASALEAVDKLDERVEGDPVLNLLRGNIYYQQGNYLKAKDTLWKLLREKPDFKAVIANLNAYLLIEKDYLGLIEVFDFLRDNFGFTKKQIIHSIQFPEYQGFLQSDEFKAWEEDF